MHPTKYAKCFGGQVLRPSPTVCNSSSRAQPYTHNQHRALVLVSTTFARFSEHKVNLLTSCLVTQVTCASNCHSNSKSRFRCYQMSPWKGARCRLAVRHSKRSKLVECTHRPPSSHQPTFEPSTLKSHVVSVENAPCIAFASVNVAH